MTTRRRIRARVTCLLLVAVAVAALGASPASASRGATIRQDMSPARVSTQLGDSFTVHSTVTNEGRRPLSGLVAHLNIVSLTHGVYVDPEDWSPRRTVYLSELQPGAAEAIDWDLKSVNGGDFAVYVVVLPGHDPATAPPGPSVSPAVDLHVAEHRSLNSGGVLPLVIAVPGLLGLLALGMRTRRRS